MKDAGPDVRAAAVRRLLAAHRDRAQVGARLHDTVAQDLTAALLQLGVLPAGEGRDAVREAVSRALDEVTRVASDLRPAGSPIDVRPPHPDQQAAAARRRGVDVRSHVAEDALATLDDAGRLALQATLAAGLAGGSAPGRRVELTLDLEAGATVLILRVAPAGAIDLEAASDLAVLAGGALHADTGGPALELVLRMPVQPIADARAAPACRSR